MNQKFALAIHGGAGTILQSRMTPEAEAGYRAGLQAALDAGRDILAAGGKSIDAVTAAVAVLEDCPLFNAGRGAVFNHDGQHEMDAALMDGRTLEAGAVCNVTGVRNPVLLARKVMDESDHVMLSGSGALLFAREHGLETADADYFYTEARFNQLQDARKAGKAQLDHSDKKFGTVGAVALDQSGNLAAATSTGGLTNKRYGRIGDSPVIGSGTYAANGVCAVSCTGDGEFFLRSVVAHDIACLIDYKGLSLEEACATLVHDKLKKIGGEGGLIAIDAAGNVEMQFNSEGMYRGFVTGDGHTGISIFRD